MASVNYGVFKVQIVNYVNEQITSLSEKKADNENIEQIENQIEVLKENANKIALYVLSEAKANKVFDDALGLEYKSAQRCVEFLFKKAQELCKKGRGMVCVSDSKVFSWVKEYYLRDDKAEYEAEKAKEEEARLKAEEAAKKRAERNAKKAEAEIKKKIKDAVTTETVTKFFSNVNPTSEILSLIGAEKYIGENIIRDDNVEIRTDVIGLALKAIEDKKLTLTGLTGKFKLTKERIAQIEEEIRAKYALTEDSEETEESEEEEYADDDTEYDELGFAS